MEQRVSSVGLILRLAYMLRRHRLLGIPMDWLGVGLMLLGSVILYRRSEVVWAGILAGLVVVTVLVIWLAKRADYLVFRRRPESRPELGGKELEADQEVRLRASGPFAVHGQERALVEQSGLYTTPRSREHIVMAKLAPTRFLVVGKSDAEGWGWWYQFFRPEQIESVQTGQAVHGWRTRPAIKIEYWVEDENERRAIIDTVLSFDSLEHHALVWADITRDQGQSDATE
jgi:hypothetical protein